MKFEQFKTAPIIYIDLSEAKLTVQEFRLIRNIPKLKYIHFGGGCTPGLDGMMRSGFEIDGKFSSIVSVMMEHPSITGCQTGMLGVSSDSFSILAEIFSSRGE